MPEFLTKRAGFWHFARRVPSFLASRDRRGVVKSSTKIRVEDDPKGVRAQRVAERMNQDLEAFWRALGLGDQDEVLKRYEEARREARAFGFDYANPSTIADRRIDEIIMRLDALAVNRMVDVPQAQDGAFGMAPPVTVRLSGLFEEYEAIMKPANTDMSIDQIRRWRHPKQRSIANLVGVVGDKALTELTRSDALDFQDWWRDRVLKKGIEIGTANKDIGHLNKMIKVVNERRRLGLTTVFGELRIEGERTKSRAAFTSVFVQTRILEPGALASMNDEARRVIYLIAETGLRLSEAVNLNAETIVLNHTVPHIRVRPDGRRMKTEQSERDIPLVGVALDAMRAMPTGFPRYKDKADFLSASVNKFLTENKLRPSKNHTLYSLRHTFEDRLTAVEAPEKLIAALMGHKYSRPKYGAGPSLEQKLEWLQRIAFTVPSTV